MKTYIFVSLVTVCVVSFFVAPVKAQEQNLEDIIRIQLKPAQEARISSPMSGLILNVARQDGESVQKNQDLIFFECGEQKAALAQTNARIKRQSRLLTSTQKLFDLGSASKTELGVLGAELEEAKAARALAQSRVNKCTIKAPFSGMVSSLSVRNHYSIQEGEPMIEIVGDSTMEIEMIVPSKWMRWLKPDLIFDVEIDETEQRYKSKVTRIGGRVDPVTQSVKLYASLVEKAPELLTGMSGQAIFEKAGGGSETSPPSVEEATQTKEIINP